jgi:hypothetical protein
VSVKPDPAVQEAVARKQKVYEHLLDAYRHGLPIHVAAPIPTDAKEIAAYWKLYYNTPLGAGTVEDFIGNWNRYLTPQPYGAIA